MMDFGVFANKTVPKSTAAKLHVILWVIARNRIKPPVSLASFEKKK